MNVADKVKSLSQSTIDRLLADENTLRVSLKSLIAKAKRGACSRTRRASSWEHARFNQLTNKIALIDAIKEAGIT